MIDSHIFEYKTVRFVTLGCKLNFAESSAIGKSLLEHGIRIANDTEAPDLVVVNTCSVTELADKKCRQAIRKIHREHPLARIIVTGCYAQLKPTEVGSIEGVDMVLGTGEKVDLADYLSQLDSQSDSTKGVHILHTPTGDIEEFAPSLSAEGRTRHFLKVQDGCDYHCTYCTIPKARGKSRNGSIESMLAQAREVVSMGGKEIVLTGVNVGDFGKTTGESFEDLLHALDKVSGIERFRISSIEPNLLTSAIIRFVAGSQRIAPHFHLPLQSGSDTVLRLMQRRYNTSKFRERVEDIRRYLPDAFIGVDVIVGSRGETGEAFEESCRFIESLPVSRLHVFSYSERPGTAALEIEHAVDPREKHRRSRRLIALSERKLREFYTSQIGTVRDLLVEHAEEGEYLYGFTENYIRVRLPYEASLQGEVVKIRPERISAEDPEVMDASLL